MQLISTRYKIIDLSTISVMIYALKSADDSSVKSSVKVKATSPTDNRGKQI